MKKLVLISEDKSFAEKIKEHLEFGEEFKIYYLEYDEKEKVEEVFPSLILLDISPETAKEGMEVLEFLKTVKLSDKVPIIVISPQEDPDFLYRILKEGADDFIKKTDDLNFIKERIKEILKMKGVI